MKTQKNTRQSLLSSFRHAFHGIGTTIKNERNIKIHIFVMVLVIAAGLFFQISITQWCICVLLFALVISLELVNTSIEAIVDMVMPQYHPLAKKAKDCAAGAVLISAIGAAFIGFVIFIPKIWHFLI